MTNNGDVDPLIVGGQLNHVGETRTVLARSVKRSNA
jgi:hypothetical protein